MSRTLPPELCTPGYFYAGAVILVVMLALIFFIAWWQRTERKKFKQEIQTQYRKQGMPLTANAIAEAGVYLAYGRKSEAIRVLEEALKAAPTRTELSDLLNKVRSGRALGLPDPLKGKRLRAIGWMLIGLSTVMILAGVALAKLLTPTEDSLVQFQGTLTAPIAFHRPPRGTLRAEFHLAAGQETGWFNVSHVDLMPGHVAKELAALPKGAEITVWVSHRSCIDEDGFDVWALSARRTSMFSFADRAMAQKEEAKRFYIGATAFFGIGLFLVAIHYGHLLWRSRGRTRAHDA